MTATTTNSDWLNSQKLTIQEEGDCETLLGLGLEGIQYAHCLKVLRKYGGDVSKAANALFEGERGDDNSPAYNDLREAVAQVVGPQPKPVVKNAVSQSVIDLTGEDEDGDISRALQASLEDQGTTFRATDRAPDPNWAVVSSNVAVDTKISQDDQAMSQAIEASLNNDMIMDTFEELPLEKRVRIGDVPVVLRPTRASYVCSSLLLQSLFFVPQIRHSIAQWRPPIPEGQHEQGVEIEVAPPTSGPALVMWTLVETYLNMDIARMTELNDDELLRVLKANHWNSLSERPSQIAFDFYTQLAWIIEQSLEELHAMHYPHEDWNRLLHFRHGYSDAEPNYEPFDPKLDVSVVNVDVGFSAIEPNDLVSSLTEQLSSDISGRTTVIFEPSEVVAFRLLRHERGGHGGREKFKYPQHIYLDQFLKENSELANGRRQMQNSLQAEVDMLMEKRKKLTRFNGRDVLADLRSSLHYFENVAEDEGDSERKEIIDIMITKLEKILERIENEIQDIDMAVSKYKSQAAVALDIPEFHKYRYDLRVVLVHDGLYGRNRVYSYVKQKTQWWKTVDYSVTPVSEEAVLTDSNGLHLGAGPFFLIYSRALSEEEENAPVPWPESQKNFVKHNNKLFFSSLSAEVAAKAEAEDPNSPPTSPYDIPTPSEYTMDSQTAEPPSSRGEPMDTST